MQFDQKVAIVTGSDSGIGRGIAIELAKEGATVVINYAHNQEKANEVLQTIQQAGGKAIILQADVSQYQQAIGLVQQTFEHFNRLDIMVNNAGMEIHSPFLEVTEEQWDRVLSVDLKGAFFCAQATGTADGEKQDCRTHHQYLVSTRRYRHAQQLALLLRQRWLAHDDTHHLPGACSL